jgi:uncharacterized membrane protein YheB (UPF0754 family)
MLKEALGYFGRSYCGLPNAQSDLDIQLEKGKLYHKWGQISGELDDFQQSYDNLIEVESDKLTPAKNLQRCELLLENLQNILKLRLKLASEIFDFLCENRLRIELRDLDFKKELHDRTEEFMAFEETMLTEGDELKKFMLSLSLDDQLKGQRKELLEAFDKGMKAVGDGLEAFYHRVKAYVLKG